MLDEKAILPHENPDLELCIVVEGSFIRWLTFLLEHFAVKQLSVLG
jgi:hypothetical protein